MDNEVRIEILHKKDFKKARNLVKRCFDSYLDYDKSGDMRLGDFSVIAKDDEDVVGNILVQKIYDPYIDRISYFLQDVCVDEKYRGQDIATKMIDKVKEIAKKRGVESIMLTCNKKRKEACGLYLKSKFKKRETEVFIYKVD